MEKITDEQIIRTIRIFLGIKQNDENFFMHCNIDQLVARIQSEWDNEN